MKGELHYVDSENEGRVEYPDKIEADGIYTCIGVGILNKIDKIGYACHYFPYTEERLELFVDKAIAEAKKVDDLTVVIVGSVYAPEEVSAPYDETPDPDEIEMLSKRNDAAFENKKRYDRWVLNMLKSKNIKEKNIQNHLADYFQDMHYSIFLDTDLGVIEVNEEGVEDDT